MEFSQIAVSVKVWALSAANQLHCHGIQVGHGASHGVRVGHGAGHGVRVDHSTDHDALRKGKDWLSY